MFKSSPHVGLSGICPCTTYCFFVCLVSLGLLNPTSPSPPCEEEYLFEKTLEVPNENPLRLNINFNELSDILLSVGSPGKPRLQDYTNVCINTYKTNRTSGDDNICSFFMSEMNNERRRRFVDDTNGLGSVRRNDDTTASYIEPSMKLFMYSPTPQTKERVVFGNSQAELPDDCVKSVGKNRRRLLLFR